MLLSLGFVLGAQTQRLLGESCENVDVKGLQRGVQMATQIPSSIYL